MPSTINVIGAGEMDIVLTFPAFHGESPSQPRGKAYQCPASDKFDSCLPVLLVQNTTIESNCEVGYDGPMCANCQTGWNHLRVGLPCAPCDDNVVNIPLLLGLLFMSLIFGGIALSGRLAESRLVGTGVQHLSSGESAEK